ncbi:MAG: hypothetical protein ACTSSH_03780 [Candidatus Heimdallarchaeota archaeon]
MTEKTSLEKACKKVLGEDSSEHYSILANLLLLNYVYIRRNDPRLSAKLTAILFDDGLKGKVHLICLFIENAKINYKFSAIDITNTKRLLEIDPELENTLRIVGLMKKTIVDEKFSNSLKLIVRKDLEKFTMAERARFIHKY